MKDAVKIAKWYHLTKVVINHVDLIQSEENVQIEAALFLAYN